VLVGVSQNGAGTGTNKALLASNSLNSTWPLLYGGTHRGAMMMVAEAVVDDEGTQKLMSISKSGAEKKIAMVRENSRLNQIRANESE
jgi:hypothetical protein